MDDQFDPTQGYDLDGDGFAESYDLDGDGYAEAVDSNLDGMPDQFDTDLDGYTDAADFDGDGFVESYDLDGDGYAEALDTDFDGVPDAFDTDGDGYVDTYSNDEPADDSGWGATSDEFDTDGDGYADALDTDGDGVPDEFDTDGDGYTDALDTDGDGVPDAFDTDGDGYVDTYSADEPDDVSYDADDASHDDALTFDLNGDGIDDATVVEVDVDGDGVTDAFYVGVDTDGDSIIDFGEGFAGIDVDGDGIVDGIYHGIDSDGDGEVDSEEIYDADSWSAMYTDADDDVPDVDDGEMPYMDGYEQFDASQTDMDQVVGTPDEDAADWEYQVEDGPCAIFAQVMAYENLTGEDVDIDAVIEAAEENGWYDPKTGTTIVDMDEVLNMLGAETEEGMGASLDDIRDCLEDDGRMVVAVDSNEIWCPNGSSEYLPNNPNHAVEVIGIDYSGEEPMVIINDSGTPDGHAIQVPASQFMDAWEDSGYAYVEAYAPGDAQ